jgi:hypothetical protein
VTQPSRSASRLRALPLQQHRTTAAHEAAPASWAATLWAILAALGAALTRAGQVTLESRITPIVCALAVLGNWVWLILR